MELLSEGKEITEKYAHLALDGASKLYREKWHAKLHSLDFKDGGEEDEEEVALASFLLSKKSNLGRSTQFNVEFYPFAIDWQDRIQCGGCQYYLPLLSRCIHS